MIPGRTPEITIKFTEKPDLPTEGKKVTIEIVSENQIKVKAELNRKTLKKQVAKMEEYAEWVGALSGKIKSIDSKGIVELESAGLQIFEVKAKETVNSDKQDISSQEKKDPPGVAKPAQANSLVESSKASDSEKPNSAKRKENSESSAEKNQPPKAIFQAVGVIEGEVESTDNKLKVSIGADSYDLKFIPGAKKRQWSRLKQEIEEQGSSPKTLIVYPQANLNKKGEIKIAFALSNVQSSEQLGNRLNLMAGEFKLAGLWQYPPKDSTPCITIRRNWEQGFVNYLEKMDSKQKAYILRPNHLPVEWSNSPTEAFRYSEEAGTEGKKPDFVSVKGVFIPETKRFKIIELLAEPSQAIPRYLKV